MGNSQPKIPLPVKSHTVLISLPHLMHLPTVVDCEPLASCKAMIWTARDSAIVLLVDLGQGASVASAADMLIPYVIATGLAKENPSLHWSQVRWFQCDLDRRFDEIRIDHYLGGITAEIAWIPRPSRMRTEAGFRTLAMNAGFDLDSEIADQIEGLRTRRVPALPSSKQYRAWAA